MDGLMNRGEQDQRAEVGDEPANLKRSQLDREPAIEPKDKRRKSSPEIELNQVEPKRVGEREGPVLHDAGGVGYRGKGKSHDAPTGKEQGADPPGRIRPGFLSVNSACSVHVHRVGRLAVIPTQIDEGVKELQVRRNQRHFGDGCWMGGTSGRRNSKTGAAGAPPFWA